MMVEMGPDRIHHGFWRFCDREPPSLRTGQPVRERDPRLLRLSGRARSGRSWTSSPPDTSVMVVSDHGAKGMKGAICINEFFIREGLLAVKEYPVARRRSSRRRTSTGRGRRSGARAATTRGSSSTSKGASRKGRFRAGEYETFRRELKEKLEAIADENGKPIGTRVFFPEEIYRECENIPPDLIVYLGNLDWRSAGTIGGRRAPHFRERHRPRRREPRAGRDLHLAAGAAGRRRASEERSRSTTSRRRCSTTSESPSPVR